MRILHILIAFVVAMVPVSAQRVALIQPQADGQVEGFAAAVRSHLASAFRIIDDSLADAAYRSVDVEDAFNLSSGEARRIGEVVGTSEFVLLRSAIQRRAALGRPAYFEGYAIAYVVDSRSGHLFAWLIETVEGTDEKAAARMLMDRTAALASRVVKAFKVNRFSSIRQSKFIEVPDEDSPLAKGLRTPVPYRRLRPEYTALASIYSVKATIDIEVDIDADGSIARTSIERWAGFGLEESVEKAVRSMNWRPAERDGTPLPMRVLLRYNFTKIEKDEEF